MAKRIIKPDSGNTLVLQEDNGSIDALTVETDGDVTLGGNLVIPNSGTIGSASATGAITIDSSGNVQLAGSLTAGTLGSGVVFPSNHPLQIKSFNTNADITVASATANGTGRILNDGSNNVAVTLTTSKANSSFMLIFGGSVGMGIDGSGDFYGNALVGFICNQAFTEGGSSRSANTQYNQNNLNMWNDAGTSISINYSAYQLLDTNDRIIPFFNPTYIKHITTTLSSGTSVTFSMTGGTAVNSEVKVRNAYITVIEF